MIQKFDSFKLKKAGDVKIITLKIDGKAVVIDQEYPRSTTWESFHADQLGGALETEPRYVLLDHDYTTTDGRPADKIILISWIPDTSPAVWKSTSATTRPSWLCRAASNAPPRYRAGVASMAWRTTRRFSTNAP